METIATNEVDKKVPEINPEGKKKRGGKQPGSGRPPGAKNKKTQAVIDAAAAKGEMPLDFMLRVMRDKSKPFDLRADMAKSAAPFLHAKLSAVEVNANVTNHEARLEDLE